MKRILGFIFIALLLVPLAGIANPADATMPESDGVRIVEASHQAVQDSIDALQAANDSGDIELIDQALQALNLAVKNYAVASEYLARLQAGEPLDDTVLTNCYVIADNLSNYSSKLLAGQLDGAQAFYTEAMRAEAFLPAPASPGVIPAGLADLSSRLTTVSSEAVSLLRAAGVIGEERGTGKLGTNTNVGSPI